MKKTLLALSAFLLVACNMGSPYSAEPLSSAGEVISSDMSSVSLPGSSSECACSVAVESSSSEALSSAEISSSSSSSVWGIIPTVIRFENGMLTDTRDGSMYRTVSFPDYRKTWMAEDLRYAAEGSTTEMAESELCYLFDGVSSSKENKCNLSGRTYPFIDSLDSYCPESWHIPDEAEWRWVRTYLFRNRTNLSKAFFGLQKTIFEMPVQKPDNNILFGLPDEAEVSYLFYYWGAPQNDSIVTFAEFMETSISVGSWRVSEGDRFRIRCVQDYSDVK